MNAMDLTEVFAVFETGKGYVIQMACLTPPGGIRLPFTGTLDGCARFLTEEIEARMLRTGIEAK